MTLHLLLLGPPRLERNGQTLEPDTRKATALLAYLAVTDRFHTRDALAALLWPEMDDSHARAALRRLSPRRGRTDAPAATRKEHGRDRGEREN